MVGFIARAVALALLIAVGGLIAPRPAGALSITHDGVGTGGVIAAASGAIDVELIDIAADAPDTAFANPCTSGQAAACLLKSWYVTGTHTMVVTPDGPSTVLAEFVFNFGETRWTDYHLAVTGAAAGGFDFGYFEFDDEGDLVGFTSAGITSVVDGNSLSLFFAQEFSSLVAEGTVLALGIIFEADGDGTFTVEQYPTFGAVAEPGMLALFGIGVAGIPLLRRRRRR